MAKRRKDIDDAVEIIDIEKLEDFFRNPKKYII